MSGYWEAPDDYGQDTSLFTGSAYSVSSEVEDAKAPVYKEVQGILVPEYEKKRRIGFLE